MVVKFDYDAAATYAGGLQGLAATSPEVTGRPLSENLGALRAYRDYAKDVEASVIDGISNRVPQAEVLDTFRIAYGGAAMTIPANQVEQLLEVDGVVAVQRNELAQPQTDASPEFIGATEAWEDLGGSQTAGEGVIVGVLDTGVWPEADSYLDPGVDAPEGDFACEFGDGADPALGDPFECNDKLIGAYAFTDAYMDFVGAEEGEFCNNDTDECSARDADGHGTHTSTTAAGSPVESAELFGIERGPISGIAPGAHIIGYRVCMDLGCFTSDSVAAVEQAIMDDIDVINFSISGGSNAYNDAVELAFLDAYAAGILVNASAGNSGPGAATADHAGPWTNTVAASTSDRHFITTLQLATPLSGGGNETLEIEGATITPGIDQPTEVVQAGDVAGYEDQLCQTQMDEGSVEGLVVVCERGGVTARLEKSFNVSQGGAAGMIMYNPTNLGLNTDNHFVPSVHVEGPEPAGEMIEFLDSNEGATAQFETGQPTEVQGDVMTSFSSRGPLGDFIKPDVTAPGIQILAGNTPEPLTVLGGPPGENYMVIAGTSMSSPHSAGVSALVKAAHPNWTPGQIKSALMTSSVQDVLKEDGVTPSDPFDRGAGSIRANRSLAPGVTFDVTAEEYFESAADPVNRIHLNLPSINAPVMSGQVNTTRTARNVTNERALYDVIVDAPEGSSINVEPDRLNIRAGESETMTININGEDLADGQYFGQITLRGRRNTEGQAVLPVAFKKTDSEIALTHSCSPDTIPRRTTTTCSVSATNFSNSDANATIAVNGPKGIDVENPEATPPGDLQVSGNGFTWSGPLSGAEAPTVDAITPGGESYFSLGGLGVPPLPAFGDESIGNIGTDPYLYGSETYDTLGVVSNGYLVVGGGTSEDVEFEAQPLPDPAAPNNVLAPFWTDLNPEAGGSIYAAGLTDGTRDWIVVEYEDVPVFSNNAETQTFQVWIETTPGTEAISFAYETVQGTGDPAGLVVGAENRDGTSGVELGTVPAGGESYMIETSPPTAGGAVTITYDATGRGRRGNYQIPARMNSDVTVGTTTEFAHLKIE